MDRGKQNVEVLDGANRKRVFDQSIESESESHIYAACIVGFLRFRFLLAESQLFCEARIPGTDKRISDSIVKWNRLEPKAIYRIFSIYSRIRL